MTQLLNRSSIYSTLSAVAISLCLGSGLEHTFAADESTAWPKAPGAAFAVRNAHFSTPRVALDAKGRELMAFECATRGRSLFGRFYDLVCDGGSFYARDAGQWVGMQVAKSGAFTVEATIKPAEVAPKTPGVVLCYGNDKGEDLAILQDKTGLSLQLGVTQPANLFLPAAGETVHLLIACDKQNWAAYRNGKPAGSGKMPAGLPAWEEREIVMGARWSGTDPWRGRMEGIAVFPRALTAEEAAGEAAAIKTLQAARKPATTIRFTGTLVRQAKTSTLDQIRPYTRSMTVAEYKVEKVLAGEWKQPTISVLHWMIMDAKRLPIADRKPGTAVEISVDRLEDHPQLESCRRDEIEGEIATDLFYCESEPGP